MKFNALRILLVVGIYLLFTGLIYGGFMLVMSDSHVEKSEVDRQSEVSQIADKIESDWQAATDGWDAELYKSQVSNIRQQFAAGVIDNDAMDMLLDRVDQIAIDCIVATMNREFQSPDASDEVLFNNMSGLRYITRESAQGYSSLPQVIDITESFALYTRILDFTADSLRVPSPQMHMEKGLWRWVPFDEYRYERNTLMRQLAGSEYYSKIRRMARVNSLRNNARWLNTVAVMYYDNIKDEIDKDYKRIYREIENKNSRKSMPYLPNKDIILLNEAYKKAIDNLNTQIRPYGKSYTRQK